MIINKDYWSKVFLKSREPSRLEAAGTISTGRKIEDAERADLETAERECKNMNI